MDYINYNKILDRESISNSIKDTLLDFEKNKHNLLIKRGIYVCGAPGSGKTQFVTNILKELNYDVIKYDAGDVRNKNVIDNIAKNNMSDKNVFGSLSKKTKSIAIIMDEIDGMNNGDKGGINSLIKLIRPKKTKKQKGEELSLTPIICISSFHVDKKIKELIKVCHKFELQSPTYIQIKTIINQNFENINDYLSEKLIKYLQYDLRKLNVLLNLYKNNNNILNDKLFDTILKCKSYNEDTKETTQKIFNNNFSINEHSIIMNDTDRTIVGLLWHENIIDILNKIPFNKSILIYNSILNKICFSDYIDRITFQKQIWQFNEMSSLMKTFYTNFIINKNIDKLVIDEKLSEIRFTKVLTKYSTEYNNSLFTQELCQKLSLDKKDMFILFIELRNIYKEEELYMLLETYEITKLDINRIYRFIDKYKKNDKNVIDELIDIDNMILNQSNYHYNEDEVNI